MLIPAPKKTAEKNGWGHLKKGIPIPKNEIAHWNEMIKISRQRLKQIREKLKSPVTDMTAPLYRELEQQEKYLKIGITPEQAALAFFAGKDCECVAMVKKFIAVFKQFPYNFIGREDGDNSFL